MKPSNPISMSTKYKLLLVILPLVGAVLVLLSTTHYGAGLSPDSVGYIGTARNIITGNGITSYNGAPLVAQPPFYPILLALVGKIIGADPLSFAHIVNAIIYGIIIYLSGILHKKHLSSFLIFSIFSTSVIAFSIPLFKVSTYAWTEPLFISLTVTSFIFAISYLKSNDSVSLLLLALSIALASLTRYIGVTLILWGGLIVLFFQNNNFKKRVKHLLIFSIVSGLPIGLWLIKNYIISNTFFGSRSPSRFTLYQNINYAFDTLLYWFVPDDIANRLFLIVFSVSIGIFAGHNLKNRWQEVKLRLKQISPILMFAIIYLIFLIISSTTTAYDRINNRLLSPVYIPFALLILILAEMIVAPYRKKFSNSLVNTFLIISMVIWLVYPIRNITLNTIKLLQNGRGYNSKAWRESEVIQYLSSTELETEYPLFTNAPDAAYILAELSTKMSPSKRKGGNSSSLPNMSPYEIEDSWPEENKAYLIWFDKKIRTYLFTPEELQKITNMELIADLEDGEIYIVTRK